MSQEVMNVVIAAETKSFQAAIKQIKNEIKQTADAVSKQALTIKEAFANASPIAIGVSVEATQENPFSYIAEDLNKVKDTICETYDAVKQKWDECVSVISNVKQTIDTTRDMAKSISENVNLVKDSINNVNEFMATGGGEIRKYFDEFIAPFQELEASALTAFTKVQEGFATLMQGDGIMAALSTTFGSGVAIILVVAAAIAAVTAALIYLWENSEQFRQIATEALNSVSEIVTSLYETVLLPLFQLLSDLFNTIIMPLVTLLSDVFIVVVDVVFTALLTLWNEVLAPIAQFLVDVLMIAIQGIIEVWEAWQPAIEKLFEALTWIWEEILEPIVVWIKEKLIKIFEEWGAIIDDIIPGIKGMFQGLIDFFVGIFTFDIDKALSGIRGLFEGFDNFLTGVFQTDWTDSFGQFGIILNSFFATAKGIWDSVKKIFQGIIDFVGGVFSGDWEKAWDGIVSIFEGIWNGVSAVLKTPINAIIRVINWVIDKINGLAFDVPDWIPGVGGAHFGLDIPKIPYLAKGGIVNHPILSVIGEAGKEAVLPLENNTGWINTLASQINLYGSQEQGMVTALLKQLIDVVERKELQIGDRQIGEANQRYYRRKGFGIVTG